MPTNKIITKILQATANKNYKKFLQTYLQQANIEDLNRIGADNLIKQFKKCWEFISTRDVKNFKISISSDADNNYNSCSYINIICDDMPFVFDSILNELNHNSITTKLILHPLIRVNRSKNGDIKNIINDDEQHNAQLNITKESHVYIVINKLNTKQITALKESIGLILTDVAYAVKDWHNIRQRLNHVIKDYQSNTALISPEDLSETIEFINWLLDDNFTFLGIREYSYSNTNNKKILNSINNTSLGVLRNTKLEMFKIDGKNTTNTAQILDFMRRTKPIFVTKANIKSLVHRRSYMDYIGIKIYRNNKIHGELKLVGLFTSSAYIAEPIHIPLIRKKITQVIKSSKLEKNSYSDKALLTILNNYPRDELFQIEQKLLNKFSLAIQQLEEKPITKTFIRVDKFDRFASILVYVKKENYNSSVKNNIGNYLAQKLDGRVSAIYPYFPEGIMARVHFIIGRNQGDIPKFNQQQIDDAIHQLTITWEDKLNEQIAINYSIDYRDAILAKYNNSFSAAYKEQFSPKIAIKDIAIMQNLTKDGDINIELCAIEKSTSNKVSLKIYSYNNPIALSSRIPIIENMGFRAIHEDSYAIRCNASAKTTKIWLHEVFTHSTDGSKIDVKQKGELLKQAFLAIWHNNAESDGFNKLILGYNIAWRDVALLRTISRYLKQTNISYSQRYIWDTLLAHGAITINLLGLFKEKFTLKVNKTTIAIQKQLNNKIESALKDVVSLDEDKVIRAFLNVINATTRTNFYQLDDSGANKKTIALKINSKNIELLPKPKPFAEIFVYAVAVEGIHLRGGKIARGGIRWSDRSEDFRTEVLGLAKAQNVKNAVIIPVGSKGGFVPKNLTPNHTREEALAEAIKCYKLFIGSLLDITDNLDNNKVITPQNTRCHDDNDPYLVVAADKGTASFSDIANKLSSEHDYWLDDAFASGGSVGYDHKKMGITARGAWEAVKRHFRELNHNIQKSQFSVIGIGDMSGDVFGNGMLLSTQIKLIAAFDHRDIFIDPNPDTGKSFAHRQKLFKLKRSSWQDYDTKLISTGGGVFSRKAKAITLSKEMQLITKLSAKTVTPNELIHALLKAKTDLLWFGGIGTYICSSTENNNDVADKANDNIRIKALDLGAKVIGEGANLGITHLGRIEFANKGGKINTDAIDNSAGVNSSDMEVNIKITLGSAIKNNKLNYQSRNKLLASMTNEVAQLVLRNNYLQTLCLSLAQQTMQADINLYEGLMLELEEKVELDRAIEFLPNNEEIAVLQQKKLALSSPELSVLLAYTKISLYQSLLESDIIDDTYCQQELINYFPKKMQKTYLTEILAHKLKRDIIATQLSNAIVNRSGITFIRYLVSQTGASEKAIIKAFIMAYNSFDMLSWYDKIDALDTKIPASLQTKLYLKLQNLLKRQTFWFMRHIDTEKYSLTAVIDKYQQQIKVLSKNLINYLPDASRAIVDQEKQQLITANIDEKFSQIMATTRYLDNATDIVRVCDKTNANLTDVAKIYLHIGDFLGIQQLIYNARKIQITDKYENIAINRTINNLQNIHRRIITEIITSNKNSATALKNWQEAKASTITNINKTIANINNENSLNLARLTVAVAAISEVLQD